MNSESIHVSVMKDEVIEQLLAANGGTFLDCTLGGGGHAQALLNASPLNFVVALDKDERAIKRAEQKFSESSSRITLIHAPFSEAAVRVEKKDFDGMLVDLGVSTDQLKEERGFSFNDEDSLDMRMDESQELTANTVVNEYEERDLIRILKKGGADSEALSAGRAIVKARPITSTAHLSKVIGESLQWQNRKKDGKNRTNPATVVLQAIRIEVNKEFQEIEAILEQAPTLVRRGGRLCVLTFHSLEDKLVTRTMRGWAQGDTSPAYLGVIDRGQKGKFLTSKPIVPSDEEIKRNPASRSARLRVFAFGEDT